MASEALLKFGLGSADASTSVRASVSIGNLEGR